MFSLGTLILFQKPSPVWAGAHASVCVPYSYATVGGL